MKREKKCVDDRRNNILKIIQSNPQVRVNELAKELGVSLITIRRDLQFLDDQELLKQLIVRYMKNKYSKCIIDHYLSLGNVDVQGLGVYRDNNSYVSRLNHLMRLR